MVFFTSITQGFEPLMPAQTPPNIVPLNLLVSLEEVKSDLHKLSTHKAVGPDGISNKLLKQLAPELAPLIERGVCDWLLGQVSDTIDPRQYARHGHSTVHALIYLMQAIHEAIDLGNYSVRIFFADFTKGFDITDHPILLDELRSFNIDQTLFFWIRSFLTNRTQAVRVGSSLSSWKQVNGGVRQGTKLGVFALCCFSLISMCLRSMSMTLLYLRLSQETLLVC